MVGAICKEASDGGLVAGAEYGSVVGPLVEQTTLLVIPTKMTGTNATSARQCFIKKLQHVSAMRRKTLTIIEGGKGRTRTAD